MVSRNLPWHTLHTLIEIRSPLDCKSSALLATLDTFHRQIPRFAFAVASNAWFRKTVLVQPSTASSVWIWFVDSPIASSNPKWSSASVRDCDRLSAWLQILRFACDDRYFSTPNPALCFRCFNGRLGDSHLVFVENKLSTKRLGFGVHQTEPPPIRISQSPEWNLTDWNSPKPWRKPLNNLTTPQVKFLELTIASKQWWYRHHRAKRRHEEKTILLL